MKQLLNKQKTKFFRDCECLWAYPQPRKYPATIFLWSFFWCQIVSKSLLWDFEPQFSDKLPFTHFKCLICVYLMMLYHMLIYVLCENWPSHLDSVDHQVSVALARIHSLITLSLMPWLWNKHSSELSFVPPVWRCFRHVLWSPEEPQHRVYHLLLHGISPQGHRFRPSGKTENHRKIQPPHTHRHTLHRGWPSLCASVFHPIIHL